MSLISQLSAGQTTGVLLQRPGKRAMETAEHVFNDAADIGVDVEDGDQWLERLKVNTPTGYMFPPHVNSTEFIEVENQLQIGSCFPKGTKVSIANGGFKNIEDVEFGDNVLTHLGNTQQVVDTMSRSFSGEMYTISVDGWGSVTSTNDHKFLVHDGVFTKWVEAKSLKIGDIVKLVSVGKPVTWANITAVKSDAVENEKVYDFEVAVDHSFVAQGIAVHNCLGVSSASVMDWNYWIRSGGKIRRFSGFFHYRKAQVADGIRGDKGSVPTTGWKIGQRFGFVPEDEIAKRIPDHVIKSWGGVYPRTYREGCIYYDSLLNDPEIAEIAENFRAKTIVRLRKQSHCIDFIKSGQGGVSQCSKWTEAFDAGGNEIRSFHGRQRNGKHGHHAYYISGYDTRRWCNITNSWSERWGDEGGKSFEPTAHQECLDDDATFAFGVSAGGIPDGPVKIKVDIADWV